MTNGERGIINVGQQTGVAGTQGVYGPGTGLRGGLPGLAIMLLLCLLGALVLMLTWSGRDDAEVSTIFTAKPGSTLSPGGGLQLSGDSQGQASGLIQFTLPDSGQGGSGQGRWVVWMPREPVRQAWLQSSTWRSEDQDFFQPDQAAGLLAPAFQFTLPDAVTGRDEITLSVIGAMPVSVTPRILSQDQAARRTQQIVALNVMVYTGLFALALVALALYWAVREKYYRTLSIAALATGALTCALNGHLYLVPGLRLFGWWGEAGIWVLVLATLVAQLHLLFQFVGIRSMTPMQPPIVRMTMIGILIFAGLLLVRLPLPGMLVQWLAGTAVVGVLGLAYWVLYRGWLSRVVMVLPIVGMFTVLVVSGGLRMAQAHGHLADGIWIRYGFQLAELGLLAGLALAMIGRVGEYRRQRDRDRRARQDSEQRMAYAATRADLAHVLQDRLRDQSLYDIEWTAFRLLLEYLLPHVPADVALVVAYGYNGRDTMVVEPIQGKRKVEEMVAARQEELRQMTTMRRGLQQPLHASEGSGYEVVVPLAVQAHGWGALILQRDGEFSADEMELAQEFARLTQLFIDEAVTTQTLKQTAEADALTGVYNRRGIDRWLTGYFQETSNLAQAFSLLFVDIDHFKKINDVHGHACGDHCLQVVSEVLRTTLRQQDLLGRYGGEEFIALLPNADKSVARMIAERLRTAVERFQVEWQGEQLQMTVSIGVATRSALDGVPGRLLERADRALYAAKHEGRNRVNVGTVEPRSEE